MTKIIYFIFDIKGWQRLNIWYRRVTKVRAHLCPARLSSQWWQNMASVSWTSSAGDLQVSQDQWQSVCWQELVQGFFIPWLLLLDKLKHSLLLQESLRKECFLFWPNWLLYLYNGFCFYVLTYPTSHPCEDPFLGVKCTTFSWQPSLTSWGKGSFWTGRLSIPLILCLFLHLCCSDGVCYP